MNTTMKAVALLAAASLAGGATAQTASKPKATYWVSADTTSGMGAMSASSMAAAAMAQAAPGAGAPAMTPSEQPNLGAMVAGSLLQNYAGYGGRGGAVAGAVGGALSTFGGLGGFGRKKAKATPAVATAAPSPAPVQANYLRTLSLDLGSSGSAPAPAADHLPPSGLQAGPALPLVTPAKATPAGHGNAHTPGSTERPRGRMLIYWGCGETAPAPIVIDFATMAAGKAPNLPSISANPGTPPSAGRHTTYGTWPNERARISIPANGSLAGEHVVRGNYAPEIRFALDGAHDFMAPLNTTTAPLASGATRVNWGAVPGATGYFAQLIGSNGAEDMVFWSSSSVPASMSNLMDWLPPAEVKRLIGSRAVMPPSQTECVVPSAVVKAVPVGMLQMIAYGDEANFAYPPKPANPKTPWNPEWTAKVRFKSTTSAMLGAPGLGS
jgi:hypothetical protein